jgi:hypothetical protein
MKVDSLSPWSYYLRYYSYYHHPQFYYHATILRYLFCNLFIPLDIFQVARSDQTLFL